MRTNDGDDLIANGNINRESHNKESKSRIVISSSSVAASVVVVVVKFSVLFSGNPREYFACFICSVSSRTAVVVPTIDQI